MVITWLYLDMIYKVVCIVYVHTQHIAIIIVVLAGNSSKTIALLPHPGKPNKSELHQLLMSS